MKIHDCIQGSQEWLKLRAGIPTASCFDQIITPGGKVSKSAERYLFTLLAERMMGHPCIEAVTTWMDRGSQSEAEAVSFYELQRDRETVKVGFITNDDSTIGASPDRFVGDDGLLEIKVPKEHTHVMYLIKKAVDQSYYPQVQGQLWVAERQWADVLSYHPEMPPALVRVERDKSFIGQLASAVTEFSKALEALTVKVAERGWPPKESGSGKSDDSGFLHESFEELYPEYASVPPFTEANAAAFRVEPPEFLTPIQIVALRGIGKDTGWSDAAMLKLVLAHGFETFSQIPADQYGKFEAMLIESPHKNAAQTQEEPGARG